MKTAPTPVPVDTITPDEMDHKICKCQWPGEPSVSTAICGKTKPIEGIVSHSDNRCPDCVKIRGIFKCPICSKLLWAGN